MPELRKDWLLGRTVLVAENRALRPNEFDAVVPSGESAAGESALADGVHRPNCPFCAGNEHLTPASVYELRDDDQHWRVRIVPNMFPALTLADVATGGSPANESSSTGGPPVIDLPPATTAALAFGVHEVIIESPRHLDRLSDLSVAELRDVLDAYAERLRFWRNDGRFRYGLVFKNQGSRAGASLAHLHSQFVALPHVPPAVDAELARAGQVHRKILSCPYCRLVIDERACGERVVFEHDGYIAFCPFASWQPFETWLLPTSHKPSFELAAKDRELDRLAGVLQTLIARLESAVPQVAYNLLLRTAPWGEDCDAWCHWRIELLPRSNQFAGLEIATAVHINPLPPERAARQLRGAAPFFSSAP